MNALSRAIFCSITLFLVGCGSYHHQGPSTYPDGPVTPIVHTHAKRGYNKPYQIKGVWYHPKQHYEHKEVGIASYYGGTDVFHGRPTSTGERFDMNRISAAHPTVPLPCVVRVTNLKNGRSLKIKVNDRGPFVKGRSIDVSRKAAQLLGFYQAGTARVKIETLVSESVSLAHKYNPAVYRMTQKPNVFVQAGAFPQTTKARLMVRTLKRQKLKRPVKIYRVTHKKKPFYRVLIGPFKSNREANFLVNKMRKYGYHQASVTTL